MSGSASKFYISAIFRLSLPTAHLVPGLEGRGVWGSAMTAVGDGRAVRTAGSDGGGAADEAELAGAVGRAPRLRSCFYVVVLLVALAGQASGAVKRLGLSWPVALVAVGPPQGQALGNYLITAPGELRDRSHPAPSRNWTSPIDIGTHAESWTNWLTT